MRRRMALLTLGGAGLAAGCGFQPVYDRAASGDLRGSVRLTGVRGSTGRQFRKAFEKRAGRVHGEPRYTLDVDLTFSESDLAISTERDVTRFDVTGSAAFALAEAGGKVLEGDVVSVSSYNTLASPYATRVAGEDAERRVSEDLADRVFARIAAYLAGSATGDAS